MKISGLVVGIAALLAAGSANANTIYNTITGYTSTGTLKLNSAHYPEGIEFHVGSASSLVSVQVALASSQAITGFSTDSGSVLVYLVNDVGGAPAATGLVLTSPILLGTILDTALQGNNVVTNITVTPGSALALSAGNYWLELTSSQDTANGGNGIVSSAEWSYLPASSLVGATYGAGSSFVVGGVAPIQETNAAFPNSFQASVTTTPEPASIAILGAGLMALGFGRRKRAKKTSV